MALPKRAHVPRTPHAERSPEWRTRAMTRGLAVRELRRHYSVALVIGRIPTPPHDSNRFSMP